MSGPGKFHGAAPFEVFETWIVRGWIGSHEAFDLLEFHKSPEYARSFSDRLNELHRARVNFSKLVTQYTVEHRGEAPEGLFALDEIRKDLKHMALGLAEHLDPIASQFDAAKPSSQDRTVPSGASEPNSAAPTPGPEQENRPAQQSFGGGQIVFHRDRVELCGADICSGSRSRSKRIVLELPSKRQNDGSFVAYSGVELEAEAKRAGAKGSSGRWIQDLRDDIMESLRNHANIVSGHKDVILSGDRGYRFAESLTVQFLGQSEITDITDITDTGEAGDVRDDDVRDVFDVPDDAAGARREWILQQLAAGIRLKAPDVVKQFKCSVKTAQRDLTALKDEGKIKFVGPARNGYYVLCKAPKAEC